MKAKVRIIDVISEKTKNGKFNRYRVIGETEDGKEWEGSFLENKNTKQLAEKLKKNLGEEFTFEIERRGKFINIRGLEGEVDPVPEKKFIPKKKSNKDERIEEMFEKKQGSIEKSVALNNAALIASNRKDWEVKDILQAANEFLKWLKSK